MHTLHPGLKEHPFSPHSHSGLQPPTSPQIFQWFSAAQNPWHAAPCWEHSLLLLMWLAAIPPLDLSSKVTYLFREVFPGFRSPLLIDWPLPSEHFSELVQMVKCLDSFLFPSTAWRNLSEPTGGSIGTPTYDPLFFPLWMGCRKGEWQPISIGYKLYILPVHQVVLETWSFLCFPPSSTLSNVTDQCLRPKRLMEC